MIVKFGLIDGPRSPRIHLGSIGPRLLSVCLVPGESGGDAGAQTADVLNTITAYLEAHGSARAKLLMAQVWLADIRDLPGFRDAWNAWIDPDHVPALSVVQAAAATRDTLVEIRVYALP